MKITRIALPGMLLLCLLAGPAFTQMNSSTPHHLLPVPARVQFRDGRLAVTRAFTVAVKGHQDERLTAGIDRALRRLEGRIALELPRGLAKDAAAATLLIECQGPGKKVPAPDEDESYSLEITDRQAGLKAATVVGVLRGLETLLQLLDSDRDQACLRAVSIQDQPRFPWRGLMIDSSRHFQPVEIIRRNLDGMAAVKLNVLHWHLTDDQGFRVESRKYPKLHLLGSDGNFYTQDQIRDVIAYATARGIRVIPEFDIPGHATSWLAGHPELGSAPGPYQLERQPGIFDPVLDPTREVVYKLLDGFLGEMAALFPDDYIHIGGDENEGKQWDSNPQIQAFKKARGLKSNHELQAYFNQRVAQILKKHGKKMIGWDEILHPDLPKDTVIESWHGPASLVEAARKGFRGILSAGYYLDLMHPASAHYAVDPIAADSGLNEQQLALILGGEAAMWSEYVSPETIDSRIWPRTAAIAERLWSPRSITDTDDLYRRLAVISQQLEELGLTHQRNIPVLLRRLTRGGDIQPLRTLLAAVEPVKNYKRGRQHPTTMLSPLTSLVDAAQADAPAARRTAALVDELLSDAPRFQTGQEALRTHLIEWRDLPPAIESLHSRSAALRDATSLAGDLSAAASAGLEALSFLAAGTAPAPEWCEAKLATLNQAAQPRDALEIVIIPALRQLVIAAAELPQLKTSSHSDWLKRVKILAAEKRPDTRR
jgi:hexosaminidase